MATWFITGASRGLGAQIARAALHGGDDVVVAVRNPDRVPDDLKAAANALTVELDVTDAAAIPAAVQAAVDRIGRIDVLVNNAGRGLLGALEEITDAEARSLFDLNVFGLIAMTRAVPPVMRRQGSGKLVHIGSRSGFEGEPGVSIRLPRKGGCSSPSRQPAESGCGSRRCRTDSGQLSKCARGNAPLKITAPTVTPTTPSPNSPPGLLRLNEKVVDRPTKSVNDSREEIGEPSIELTRRTAPENHDRPCPLHNGVTIAHAREPTSSQKTRLSQRFHSKPTGPAKTGSRPGKAGKHGKTCNRDG